MCLPTCKSLIIIIIKIYIYNYLVTAPWLISLGQKLYIYRKNLLYPCLCPRNRTKLIFNFFTCLWSVCKALLFDTQNPQISGFSTAHAYKYETKRQAKKKHRQKRSIDKKKRHFCWLVTMYLKSEQCTQTINEWRKSKLSVFLLTQTTVFEPGFKHFGSKLIYNIMEK